MTPAGTYTSRAKGRGRKLASTSPVVAQMPHPAMSADPWAACAVYHGSNVAAVTANTPRTTIVHLVSVASMAWSPDHGWPMLSNDEIHNIPLRSRSLRSHERCAESRGVGQD